MTRHSIARPSGKQWQTLTRRQLFACATQSYVDWRTIQYELRWARHIEPSESGTPRPCSPQLMRYTRQRVLLRIRPRLPQAQHSFSQVSHSIPLRLMSPFSPGRENHDACLPGAGHRWRVGRARRLVRGSHACGHCCAAAGSVFHRILKFVQQSTGRGAKSLSRDFWIAHTAALGRRSWKPLLLNIWPLCKLSSSWRIMRPTAKTARPWQRVLHLTLTLGLLRQHRQYTPLMKAERHCFAR